MILGNSNFHRTIKETKRKFELSKVPVIKSSKFKRFLNLTWKGLKGAFIIVTMTLGVLKRIMKNRYYVNFFLFFVEISIVKQATTFQIKRRVTF